MHSHRNAMHSAFLMQARRINAGDPQRLPVRPEVGFTLKVHMIRFMRSLGFIQTLTTIDLDHLHWCLLFAAEIVMDTNQDPVNPLKLDADQQLRLLSWLLAEPVSIDYSHWDDIHSVKVTWNYVTVERQFYQNSEVARMLAIEECRRAHIRLAAFRAAQTDKKAENVY